jgi:hypothetical protein
MNRVSVALFFGCIGVCLGQAKKDPHDVMQYTAEYFLKGLSSVQVCPLASEEDPIKQFSMSAITLSDIRRELVRVLKRSHVPVSVSSAACVQKDDNGIVFLLSRTTGKPGDSAAVFTLSLRVCEPVLLKRDPSRKVVTVDWDDEQQIDAPSNNAKERFQEAIRQLGKRFALAYLAANK